MFGVIIVQSDIGKFERSVVDIKEPAVIQHPLNLYVNDNII